MREGWKACALEKVCTLQRGFDLPKKNRISGQVALVSASGAIDYHNEAKVSGPGVVTGRSGSIGNVFYIEGDFWPLNTTLYVKDFHGNLPRFIYYLLSSFNLKRFSSGAGVPTLNRNSVHGETIKIPVNLEEQKRIVAILDEAFADIDSAIANTEKNLANAHELFESYLNAVFSQRGEGWYEDTLKNVCLDYGRGKSKHRPRNDPQLYGGEYPFIQTGDVRKSDHLITRYSSTYNEAGFYQSKLWPKGTICITIAANIAETGVLDFDACFPDSIIGMVVDESKATSGYVEFLLQSMKSVLKAKGKGSAQDNINLATFEKEKFPFPDIEVQKQIVEDVQDLRLTLRRLENIYQQKLEALTELKQSLLQKAFSGELSANKVVPITAANKPSAALNTDSPAFAAHIMAAAYHWHEAQSRDRTFGRVKAQKTLHLVEALASIDMGRNAVKDAAGPNDMAHMRTAEHWAENNEFFQFVQRRQGQRGYDFVKGSRYGEWLPQALEAIEPWRKTLDRVISLLMRLDTWEAELVATVYAAWNNLLLQGDEPTEADIIYEARENWHPDKLQYSKAQFREAIDRLRRHGMVPDGSAKRVGGQESLEL